MNLMAKLRHRVFGHLMHGEDVAAAYMRQPDGNMTRSGFIVHMHCVRTGCDYTVKKRLPAIARPRADTVVSLQPESEE